jgi:hypothetical protein
MKYIIYKLVHPKFGVVYVGKTKQTLKGRRRSGYKANPSVNSIIDECDMVEIERTDNASRESYWTDYYGIENLMNKRRGDGVDKNQYQKEYRKDYYSKNKEILIEKQKDYQNQNADKIKEYRKEYELKNADKIRERQKEYMKEYRIRTKEKRKEYLAKNADKIRERHTEYMKVYRDKNK